MVMHGDAMMLQFSVSNFRCFQGVQTLNFAASAQDKTLPGACMPLDLPGLMGRKWIKGVALYGANGSGKSTVLDALKALVGMVEESAKQTDPKEPIPHIDPFRLTSDPVHPPTAFSIAFVAEGVRYEYRVAATIERIWHESLRAFPKKSEQLWFMRDWAPQEERYVWSPERPTGFKRDQALEGYTPGNVLYLSKAIANNRSDLEPVFRWFKERIRFLDLSARNDMSPVFTLKQIDNSTSLGQRALSLLRYADLGISGGRLIERNFSDEDLANLEGTRSDEEIKKLKDSRLIKPELFHKGLGSSEYPLPWEKESMGTRRFFALAGPWLDIMSKGYTVCIDELDTSMHPMMVRELLRLFFSEQENSVGSQVLFTTHNPLLLDTTIVRRDQIWFTEKDEGGSSHLYPLTDFSPRKGESLVRGYMTGRYGAIPFIPEGLFGGNMNAHAIADAEQGSHE
jgi:AAA15 family ATPase/GTPase